MVIVWLYRRLRRGRLLRWRFLFGLALFDVFGLLLVEMAVGGFGHTYVQLVYYPVCCSFVVLFSSLPAGFALVSLAVVCRLGLSVVSEGVWPMSVIDLKGLVAWVTVMYVLCGLVASTRWFWNSQWLRVRSDNRALVAERVEASRAIHDTAAQMSYMVSLGLDSARTLSDAGDPALPARLAATSQLARSLSWQLRHLIDVAPLYEGEALRSVLRSNLVSFSNITAVAVDFECRGDEPELAVGIRRVLFTVAHNALANAYRHAAPTRVLVELVFDGAGVRLAVSDAGPGLPEDYRDRGHGFANMARELSACGGSLMVERRGALGGATVAAAVPPLARSQGGA